MHGCTAYVDIVGLLRCTAYVGISGILVKLVCLIVLPFFLVNVFFFRISLCSGLRGGKEPEEGGQGGGEAKCFNMTVRCSLGEVKTCAKMLQPRHKTRVIKCNAPRPTLQKTSIYFVIDVCFFLLALFILHCIISSCHHVI